MHMHIKQDAAGASLSVSISSWHGKWKQKRRSFQGLLLGMLVTSGKVWKPHRCGVANVLVCLIFNLSKSARFSGLLAAQEKIQNLQFKVSRFKIKTLIALNKSSTQNCFAQTKVAPFILHPSSCKIDCKIDFLCKKAVPRGRRQL